MPDANASGAEDYADFLKKPLTAEEYAAILWPGMFQDGWQKMSVDNPFMQAHFYCLNKAEKMLQTIEVYRK